MAFEQNQQLMQLLRQQSPMQQNNLPSVGFSQLPSSNNRQGFLSKLFGGLKDFTVGTPGQLAYSTQYTPQQQQALQALLQSGIYNQQNPYEGFDLLQNQIMDQYHNQILPQIAEQFTSLGGAPSSPDFLKQLRGGNQGLASMLLAHKLNYGQQNRQFGLQQTQMGLAPQYENAYIPGQPGALQALLGSAPAIAQTGLRAYLGV